MSMIFASPSPMMTLTLPPIHTCLDDEFDTDIPFPEQPLSPHICQPRSNIYIPKHRKQPSTPPLQAIIQPQDEIQKMITLVEDGNKDGVLALLAYHRSTTSSLLDLSHQYNQRQTHHPSPQPLIWTLLDEALCASACRGHVDLVMELLEQPWVNLNAYREQDSMTPLFLAAQYHHISIVSLLIIKGASTDYNRIIKRQKQRRQVMTRFDDTKMATVQHLELQYLASVSTELEELGHDHDDDDSDEEEEDEEAWDEEFISSARQDRLDVTLPIAIVDIILDYTRVMGTGGYPD